VVVAELARRSNFALNTGSVDSFLAISSVETLALSKLLISSSTTLGAVGNAGILEQCIKLHVGFSC
jgi:hypothetical protein